MRPFAIGLLVIGGCDRVLDLREVPYDIGVDASSDADGIAADARGRPTSCPPSYSVQLASSSSYYRVMPGTPWAQAANACAADRVATGSETHLVVLSNDMERSELVTLMSGLEFWIGFSDRASDVDDAFIWVTAEDTGTYPMNEVLPWDSDQPDAVGPACAEVRVTGQLHDEDCQDASPAVCECDEFPDVPANR